MRCCEDYIFTSLRQRSSKSIRVILLALYQYFIPYGTWLPLPLPPPTKARTKQPLSPPSSFQSWRRRRRKKTMMMVAEVQRGNYYYTVLCAATRECFLQCYVVCTYVAAAAAQLLVVSLNAAESREKQKCLELSSSLCCIPPLPPTSLLLPSV